MTRCVIFVAVLSLAAFADDLSVRLDREFALLASDDASQRDTAVEAIAKEGRAAEPLIQARLKTETDVEVRARLERAIVRIGMREVAARTYRPVWTATPFAGGVAKVAVSKDGARAAVASPDEDRMAVYDTATGKLVCEMLGARGGEGNDLGFTADGGRLVMLGQDEHGKPVVNVWDARTGEAVATIPAVKFARDVVVFRGADITVFATDPDDKDGWGRFCWIVDASGVAVAAETGDDWQAISADGKRIALGFLGNDPDRPGEKAAEVRVLDAATGQVAGNPVVLPLDFPCRFTLRISPDATAAAALGGKRVRVVSLADGSKRELERDAEEFDWAGKDLAVLHADGVVRWWSDGKAVREVKLDDAEPGTVEAYGGVIALIDRQGVAAVCDVKGEILDRFAEPQPIRMHSSDALVLGVDVVHAYAGGRAVREPLPWVEAFKRAAPMLVPGGVIAWAEGRVVAIRRLDRPEFAADLPLPGAQILELQWTRDGIAAEVAEFTQVLLDPVSGRELESPNQGKALAASGRLINLGDLRINADADLQVSADGRTLVELRGGVFIFYDLDTTSETRRIEAPGAAIRRFAISADGKSLAFAMEAGFEVEVRDVATGEARHIATGTLPVEWLRFAPKGDNIVVAGLTEVGSRLRVLSPSGETLAEGEWLEDNNIQARVALGRFLAAVDSEFGNLFLLDFDDLKAGMRKLPLSGVAELEEDINPSLVGLDNLFESPDGDHFLIEPFFGGVVYASGRTGFVASLGRRAQPFPRASGFLAGGHPAVVSPEGLRVYYAGNGEEVLTDKSIRGQTMAASPDGKRFAVAMGGRITVYEVR